MILAVAALIAPLGALVPHDESGTIHAVTMEAIVDGWEDGELVTACGIEHVKLLDVPLGSENVVYWPPGVKSLPDKFNRCKACQKATGNKRPRCHFATKPQVNDVKAKQFSTEQEG